MANPKGSITQPDTAQGQVQESIAPGGTAYRVRNFVLGPNGSLRTVRGPLPFVPDYGGGYPADYGRMHGVYHCMLHEGTRDVLLLHTGSKIVEFNGWQAGSTTAVFRDLVASSGSPLLTMTLQDRNWSTWPTQFESDGKRVFIAMAQGEAPLLAYDGFRIAELGYSMIPGAPVPRRLQDPALDETANAGAGKIGTYDPSIYDVSGGGQFGGLLELYLKYVTQFRDIWGDLSAPSPEAILTRNRVRYTADDQDDRARIAVTVGLGPSKTAARRLFRTPDLNSTLTIELREIYGSLGAGGSSEFYPDNISQLSVDNTSDAFLGEAIEDIRPFPKVRLIRIAMGRMFLGHEVGDPGILYWSKPGRFGTVGKFDFLYPDPNGSGLTGLARHRDGLLAMTQGGVFLVYPSSAAQDSFQSIPVPGGEVGCVAPSSIQTMQSGLVVWLGTGGFYAFDGQKVIRVSDDIRQTVEKLDKARLVKATAVVDPTTGEYICAVSTGAEAEVNDLILVWDGEGWRERTDADPRAMCVTQDHRKMILAAGHQDGSSTNGLWALNHAGFGYTPVSRSAIFESRFEFAAPGTRQSVTGLVLIMREGSVGTGTVEFFRDGSRAEPAGSNSSGGTTFTFDTYYKDRPSPKWGTATYGGTSTKWQNRRVFPVRIDCSIPNAYAWAFKLTLSGDAELVAYQWVMAQPRASAPGAIQ